MSKKIFNRLLSSVIVFCVILIGSVQAFAADEQSIDARSSKYISGYTIFLENGGDGLLDVYSDVATGVYVDVLEIVSLNLQELVDTNWVTVASWNKRATNTYVTNVSGSYQGTVAKCYRVVGTYRAQKGTYSETKTLTSESLYAMK